MGLFSIKSAKPKKEKETFVIKEKESEYDKQANKFLKDTNTKFSIKYVKHDKYFPDDKDTRDIYRFKLEKDGKTYSGTFGQSIVGSEKGEVPSAYDILAGMTKGEIYSFEDFSSEFGYDEDNIKAHKIYKAVKKEQEGLHNLYSEEELDKLSEIS